MGRNRGRKAWARKQAELRHQQNMEFDMSAKTDHDRDHKHLGKGHNSAIVAGKTFARDCHIGAQHVMTIGNAKVFAGGFRDFEFRQDFDLIIRLGGQHDIDLYARNAPGLTVRLNEAAKKLVGDALVRGRQPAYIDIFWPDFGTPSMDRTWWAALLGTIKTLPPESKVGVHCHGGHGRTGTAMTILAVLADVVSEHQDPVVWLRKKYCTEVVESASQIDYIEKITGKKIIAKPAWIGSRYGSYADYNYGATGKANVSTTHGTVNAKYYDSGWVNDHFWIKDTEKSVWRKATANEEAEEVVRLNHQVASPTKFTIKQDKKDPDREVFASTNGTVVSLNGDPVSTRGMEDDQDWDGPHHGKRTSPYGEI